MSQVVFITGVSSGIGFGLAREYLLRGSSVIGVSRRTPEPLLKDPKFKFAAIDLTDEHRVQSELPKLLPGVPKLDSVILNAGMLGELSDMKDCSLNQLKRLMDVNVWANKTVLDVILSRCQTEKVISMSSGAAVNGNRGWSGYSISKAALNMLTMLYARENEQTFFAAIAPGLVDTAMQDYLCGTDPDSRFPSLDVLKSKRGTEEMPNAEQAAKKLISLIETAENHVESGGFVDIRHLPEIG